MSTIIYTSDRKSKEQSLFTKHAPFTSYLKSRQLLNAPNSSKQTFHICLNLKDSSDSYKEGDAVAIFPKNPMHLISSILNLLQATGDESLVDPKTKAPISLKTYLTDKSNLSRITSALLTLFSTCSNKNLFLQNLLIETQKTERAHYIQSHDVLTCLKDISPLQPLDLQAFITSLAPMLPRFYSIASSLSCHPEELHLLVTTFSYKIQEEERTGVGSDFLCYRADILNTPISMYIQSNPNFSLPSDPNTPIIMIGAGTGVAPYRAFLQKRSMEQTKTRNWLFFGERNRQNDFYYEEELQSYVEKGLLKLTTAFSRDQLAKCYVQHQMTAHSKELWEWIEQGATLYVCGDAKHMAKDVQQALIEIIHREGGTSLEEAAQFLQRLRKEKRYQTDVY